MKTAIIEPRRDSGAADLVDLAEAFAALGEPKRLGILATLADGEQCACDLTACCGDRQPLLSFHLRRLREAGLVRARKEGRWMHYSLDSDVIAALSGVLARLAAGDVESSCAEAVCC